MEIEIFGEFGTEVQQVAFKEQLAVAGGADITAKIDSFGGSVFAGLSMFDAAKAYEGKKIAVVESTAFSIASYFAMAFDEIHITPNGYFMIHNPFAEVEGDADELARQSVLLGKLKGNMIAAYAAKTGKEPDEIKTLMQEESYFNAEEALAIGLVDKILDQPKPMQKVNAAAVQRRKFNLPQRVAASLQSSKPRRTQMSADAPATIQEIESAFPKISDKALKAALRANLPMAKVGAEAFKAAVEEIDALKAENDELKAKVSAMEEEMAKAESDEEAKAKAMEEEEAKARAAEEEEKQAKAKAKAHGGKALNIKGSGAGGGSARGSAQQCWNKAVNEIMASGGNRMTRIQAVQKAAKENPELQAEMVEEANA